VETAPIKDLAIVMKRRMESTPSTSWGEYYHKNYKEIHPVDVRYLTEKYSDRHHPLRDLSMEELIQSIYRTSCENVRRTTKLIKYLMPYVDCIGVDDLSRIVQGYGDVNGILSYELISRRAEMQGHTAPLLMSLPSPVVDVALSVAPTGVCTMTTLHNVTTIYEMVCLPIQSIQSQFVQQELGYKLDVVVATVPKVAVYPQVVDWVGQDVVLFEMKPFDGTFVQGLSLGLQVSRIQASDPCEGEILYVVQRRNWGIIKNLGWPYVQASSDSDGFPRNLLLIREFIKEWNRLRRKVFLVYVIISYHYQMALEMKKFRRTVQEALTPMWLNGLSQADLRIAWQEKDAEKMGLLFYDRLYLENVLNLRQKYGNTRIILGDSLICQQGGQEHLRRVAEVAMCFRAHGIPLDILGVLRPFLYIHSKPHDQFNPILLYDKDQEKLAENWAECMKQFRNEELKATLKKVTQELCLGRPIYIMRQGAFMITHEIRENTPVIFFLVKASGKVQIRLTETVPAAYTWKGDLITRKIPISRVPFEGKEFLGETGYQLFSLRMGNFSPRSTMVWVNITCDNVWYGSRPFKIEGRRPYIIRNLRGSDIGYVVDDSIHVRDVINLDEPVKPRRFQIREVPKV